MNVSSILDYCEPGEYEPGQEVDLVIYSETDLGYKAVVNNKHWGVIFYQEVFQPLKVGQVTKAFIKRIREDGKIDLILYREGNKDSEDIGEKILEQLKLGHGYLPLTDKSPPEVLYHRFGVSKKKFKIALGGLYKKRLITIREDGIILNKDAPIKRGK